MTQKKYFHRYIQQNHQHKAFHLQQKILLQHHQHLPHQHYLEILQLLLFQQLLQYQMFQLHFL